MTGVTGSWQPAVLFQRKQPLDVNLLRVFERLPSRFLFRLLDTTKERATCDALLQQAATFVCLRDFHAVSFNTNFHHTCL